MNQEQLWSEFSTLPPMAQRLVLSFMELVQKYYGEQARLSLTKSAGFKQEMETFLNTIRHDHPFAHLSKEEIWQELHQTRTNVYDEVYGDRHAN